MSSPGRAPPVDYNLITSPVLLGNLLNYGLLGVLSVQLFFYYLSFPKDKTWYKVLTYGVYILDVLQTIFTTHAAWIQLGSGWGNVTTLGIAPWSLCTVPPLSGLISSAVQLFFAWRLRQLGAFVAIPFSIATLSVAQCIMGIITGYKLSKIHFLRNIDEERNEVAAWLGGSAACDIIITISMLIMLRNASSTTSYAHTHRIIRRAMQLTLETGAMTTFGAVMQLILFTVFPHANLHMIFGTFLGKLYSNTLFVNLNIRTTYTTNTGQTVLSATATHDMAFAATPPHLRDTDRATTTQAPSHDLEIYAVPSGKESEPSFRRNQNVNPVTPF